MPPPESPPVDLGTAGASAKREHARRKTAREGRVRQRFGAVGVAAIRLVGEPQHQAAWAIGEAGEVKLAARLEKLLDGSGVVLLHDRRLAWSRANIDHLAVGRGGVAVIDAKNHKGKIRVGRRGGLFRPRTEHLLVAGRDRTTLVAGVEKQVATVKGVLEEAGIIAPVRGALCFVEVDGLPLMGHLSVRQIAVDGPRHVARLASRGGVVDVDRVVRILAVAFPPA